MQTEQRRQDDKLNKCMNENIHQMSAGSETKQITQARRMHRYVRIIVAFVLVQASILTMISYAWYSFMSERKVYSEDREVMPPYYLYLVEENGTDRLQLNIGNLHPGETKQVVIGVTNKEPNGSSDPTYQIGKDSSFHYELELVYTKNLPLKYQIYALQKVDSASDQTIKVGDNNYSKKSLNMIPDSSNISKKNNEEMYGADRVGTTVNVGTYTIYDKTSGTDFTLDTTIGENGKPQFDLDYYMIELSWEDGIQFADYLKETDLIYVLVNAMQLEPEETTQTTTP